jgi:uncharacterized protein (DUF302 family)
MPLRFLFALLVLAVTPIQADLPGVYEVTVDRPMDEVYGKLSRTLDENRFFVVFEPDMGARMAQFAERWGEDYNRSGLAAIRSMVFCNLWYTNAVANADPAMLAVCPLHVSLYEQDGRTTVLFPRPTVVGRGSPAQPLLEELEAEVIRVIESGLRP